MTAPLTPEHLAALGSLAASLPLPLASEGRHVDGAAGRREFAAADSPAFAAAIVAACNALPGLLATLADRDREIADRDREIAALRERLALTEARTAVPPPRDALPGLRALAASEAAAEVLRLAAPEVLP